MSNVFIERSSGRGVAERWYDRYCESKIGWRDTSTGSSKTIHDQLLALGRVPTADEVANVIGNKSWGHLTCSTCHDDVNFAIRFTGPYRDKEILICSACIEQAHQAFTSPTSETGDE